MFSCSNQNDFGKHEIEDSLQKLKIDDSKKIFKTVETVDLESKKDDEKHNLYSEIELENYEITNARPSIEKTNYKIVNSDMTTKRANINSQNCETNESQNSHIKILNVMSLNNNQRDSSSVESQRAANSNSSSNSNTNTLNVSDAVPIFDEAKRKTFRDSLYEILIYFLFIISEYINYFRVRAILRTEDMVYRKAKNQQDYVSYFRDLFMDITNQCEYSIPFKNQSQKKPVYLNFIIFMCCNYFSKEG